MNDNEKQEFCWKRKNKCSQTNSQSEPILQKQINLRNIGSINHRQKLTLLPGDKNWKGTKKNVGNEAGAPLEKST